jgi:hypothetical protein
MAVSGQFMGFSADLALDGGYRPKAAMDLTLYITL